VGLARGGKGGKINGELGGYKQCSKAINEKESEKGEKDPRSQKVKAKKRHGGYRISEKDDQSTTGKRGKEQKATEKIRNEKTDTRRFMRANGTIES